MKSKYLKCVKVTEFSINFAPSPDKEQPRVAFTIDGRKVEGSFIRVKMSKQKINTFCM
jgi:hypothetical protein